MKTIVLKIGKTTANKHAVLAMEEAKPNETPLLQFLYEHIDCQLVERVECLLNGKAVTIWLDEEGLLKCNAKDKHKIYGFSINDDRGYQLTLAGTLVLTGQDSDDDNVEDCELSLSDVKQLIGKQIFPTFFQPNLK